MIESKEIRIGIRGVRTLGFILNELLFRNNDDAYSIDFTHQINSDFNRNLLMFSLRATFYYTGATKENILFDILTEHSFEIYDLKDYSTSHEDKIRFEFGENVWLTIVSLSISHTRALLSSLLAPTVYKQMIILIVDPLAITRTLFPTIVKSMP